ncbi:MAG: hypothetical protein KAV87_19130 [Desulfobacteraceae bacterium]|nr:hypothetical protein [Desulfobacteraceae bacterium]
MQFNELGQNKNTEGGGIELFQPNNYQEVTHSRDQIVPVFGLFLYFFKKDKLRCVTGFIITRLVQNTVVYECLTLNIEADTIEENTAEMAEQGEEDTAG